MGKKGGSIEEVPLVSVIMPCFNGSQFVERAIESVLNQSYSSVELLVYDDGSVDGSHSVIERFLGSLRFFRGDVNNGVAYARNFLLRESKGDFVAFLDADDVWSLNKLEIQIAAMRTSGVLLSCTSTSVVDEKDQFICLRKISGFKTRSSLLVRNFVCNSSLVVRRELALSTGFRKVRHEDYDFVLRASLEASSILCVKCPLVSYRRHSGGISANKFLSLVWHFRVLRLNGVGLIHAYFLTALRAMFNISELVVSSRTLSRRLS